VAFRFRGGGARPTVVDMPRPWRGGRVLPWAIAAALALILGFHFWELSLSAQWYTSMGAAPLFWQQTGAPWAAFVLGAAAMLPGAYLASDAALARGGLLPHQRRRPAFAIAAVAAFLFGLGSTALAPTAVLFLHARPMGVRDPVFHQDVGFYVFALPMYEGLLAEALFLMLPWLVVAWLRARRPAEAVRWLCLLGGWEAVRLYLERYQVLYSHQGVVQGASYTDLHANLPLLSADAVLMAVVTLAVGIAAPRLVRPGPAAVGPEGGVGEALRLSRAGVGILAAIAAAVLASLAYPPLLQATVVAPNELARELPYLAQSIRYTRLAYGLSAVRVVNYPGTGAITAKVLADDPETVDNIRLADASAVASAVAQQQAFQPYYQFSPLSADRYVIDGKLVEVLVAGRLLNPAKVPAAAQTWAGRTLLYTHGYGAVMIDVERFTPSGAPMYLESQMPVQGVLPLRRPQIYFGPGPFNGVVVPSGLPEFDYPDLSGVEHDTHFVGHPAGSVPLTFMNRLRLALAGPSLTWFTSGYIEGSSYWVTDRNVMARLNALYPQMIWSDARFVIADGGLYVMANGYTATDAFPDASPYEGINYLHQDAVAVVNAYSGRTRLYAFHNDGILDSYISLDPALWRPLRDLPLSLRRHMEYGSLGMQVQAAMLGTFHVQDPRAFYLREAVWQEARQVVSGNTPEPIPPYHVIMKDPTDGTGFYLITPFSPLSRSNLTGWLSASENLSDFGRLTMYVIPAERTVTGPLQAESLISQNPVIAEQLNLLDQGGSRVLRGNLLTYPMGGGILYVEPEYVQSQGNPFPQLKEVALVSGTTAVMAPTLRQALAELTGASPSSPARTPPAGTTHGKTGTLRQVRSRLAALSAEVARLSAQIRALQRLLARLG
jgi:uncharacterized membrane protein (UPF0182 family)